MRSAKSWAPNALRKFCRLITLLGPHGGSFPRFSRILPFERDPRAVSGEARPVHPQPNAVAEGLPAPQELFDQMIEATPPASITKLAAAGRKTRRAS
jgi:hypothetical protein